MGVISDNPPVLDYPCGRAPGREPRTVIGSTDPGTSLGGCVCPADAYVGQRDCTETNDLHQDANGIEVLGGEVQLYPTASTDQQKTLEQTFAVAITADIM